MKKIVLSVFATFLLSVTLMAQGQRVSGNVTAEDGSAIAGVTVIIKGTEQGTITNGEGKYSIVVSKDGTLAFSFVGMQNKEVPVAGRTTINVQLKDDVMSIDEVVVTGMGLSREKKALGYATQNLKAKEITAAGNTNVINSLQGKVAGVQITPSSGMPGASSQIIIRGARSFTGNNTPLYVVDGMPIASTPTRGTGYGVTGTDFANRAVDIDPNDIESINILKGQAASALYGIRASNGVVIITTKNGRNQQAGKPIITFSQTTSVETMSRYPEKQTTWAQGSGGEFDPNNSMSWGPKISNLPNDPTYGGNSKGYPGKYRVPQLEKAGLFETDKGYVTPGVYDNIRDFIMPGFTSSTSAGVSQATERSSYSVSAGATIQEGIIPETGMDRYNVKVSAETKLSTTWKSGFSGNYSSLKIAKAPGANDAILGAIWNAPANYNLKGTPYTLPNDPYTQINYRSLTFNNPYWAVENNSYIEQTNRFFGNAYLQFDPNIGEKQKISFKYQFGVDAIGTNYEDTKEMGHAGKKGSIENNAIKSSTYNSLLLINYSLDINADLKLTATLGNEVNHTNFKEVYLVGKNFSFGGWPKVSNATVQYGIQGATQERTVGFFANANLSYRDMLYLGITAREDIVSTMPKNNRSFFYPSASVGFVFTELDGLKGGNLVSFGKLRASYAQVGQAGNYYEDYYTIPSYGGGFWQGEPVIYPVDGIASYIPNHKKFDPNLKPQNTISYEVGTDLRLFNNIIDLSYTYSRQNVTGQIFPVPLAGSTGYSTLVMNGGKIHTNAHELMVNASVISGKNWKWDINANFTKISNYVDELSPGVESIFLGGFIEPHVRAGIGYTFPVIYGSTFKRDEQGRILVDENPDSDYYGMPMVGAPDVIGSVSPNFNLGFGTTLSYKNITLSATFDWKNGGQMYSGTNGLMKTLGVGTATEDRSSTFVFDGYKADGTKNDIVRGGANDLGAYQLYYADALNVSEAYIYDNDFVKLRELSIGYNLKLKSSVRLRFTAFARNILLWSALPNLDPESSQGNNNMAGGFERLSLPQTSSYGLAINLTF